MTKFNIGDIVSIDTDNDQWGRVCGQAEVLEQTTRRLFLNVFSIRANIWVNKSDCILDNDNKPASINTFLD